MRNSVWSSYVCSSDLHAQEFASSGFDSSAAAGAVPTVPIIFTKVPESVTAAGADILMHSTVDPAVDYEVELTVIIGNGGRGIQKAAALQPAGGHGSEEASVVHACGRPFRCGCL